MTKSKAKHFTEKPVADWNVRNFHDYLMREHDARFGVPYYPFGKWAIEQRMLRGVIDDHGALTVKAFIDRCLREYTPTDDYPGINFGFMFKFMNRYLQQAIAEGRKQAEREQRRQDGNNDEGDDLTWI